MVVYYTRYHSGSNIFRMSPMVNCMVGFECAILFRRYIGYLRIIVII